MRGRSAAALGLSLVLACLPTAALAQTPPEEEVLSIVTLNHEPDSGQAEPDVQSAIVEAAQRWGVDEQTLLRIAWCESRWDPLARGPAGLSGLFQFAPITWDWVSERVGYPGASPFDLRANAEAAAWLYRTEGPKHWGCK